MDPLFLYSDDNFSGGAVSKNDTAPGFSLVLAIKIARNRTVTHRRRAKICSKRPV